ncbi:hypothetical protein BKA64DRAFT_714330 [Cadophora sp. MPI-SDFR-AT-0126]|nr:hypothetical protein BKA64DRAFT_714330 [Leotiomycetes sp. MPI-SDFR-AT-0126]
MRVQASNLPLSLPHDQCNSSFCTITCIAQAKENISLYLTELSRVFFQKENMRNKATWWLSVFYSLCIQSFVKRALWEMETEISDSSFFVCKEYLKLPVSLFIGSSGFYDPLSSWFTVSEVEGEPQGPTSIDYREAIVAVNKNVWEADGIRGSSDFLKRLFADSVTGEHPTLNYLFIHKDTQDLDLIRAGTKRAAELSAYPNGQEAP